MANKRKNKNTKNINNEKKKFPKKKAIILGIGILCSMLAYYALASVTASVMPIYTVCAAVVFVIYFALNKGVMTVPKPENLSSELTKSEKEKLIAEIKAVKKKTEILLYIFLSLSFTLLCDLIYLFVTINLGFKI